MSKAINGSGPEMPDFETLADLAARDPIAFEKIRDHLIEKTIYSQPESKREKLARLQFRIDGVIRRSSNPVHACVLLNGLLLDSAANLLDKIDCLPGTSRLNSYQEPIPERTVYLELVRKEDP